MPLSPSPSILKLVIFYSAGGREYEDLLPEGVSSLLPTAGRSGSALGSVGPFLKGGLTAAAEEDEAASEAVAAVWVAAGF